MTIKWNRNRNTNQSKLGAWALTFVMLLGTLVGTLPLTACSQTQIADLTNTLGTSAANIAKLEGNSTLSTKMLADTAAAVAAIDSWKSGSPATEAIEALNLVEDDLNLIPGTSQYAALVDLCIGTVESILALLPQTSTTTTAPTAAAANVARRHVALANPPKTAKQFRQQWDAIVKANPALAAAKL
jgi:hypothetical protein